MSARGRKLITADESAVPAKPSLDLIVVENSERNARFPDPPCTDESDGFKIFSEFDDLLNQSVASETDSRGRGRGFTRRLAVKT